MVTLDDKNNVRCNCGSKEFEKHVSEENIWETLAIKEEDGRIVHKAVCVKDVVVRLFCSQCGEEIKRVPEPIVLSERPVGMIEKKETQVAKKIEAGYYISGAGQ